MMGMAVTATTLGLLGVAAAGVVATTNSTKAYTGCCAHLEAAGLAERLLLPNSAAYDDRVDSWWSVSAQLTPYCIVQPQSAHEVSVAVAALAAKPACQFAVRSGGHFTWAGGNNIDDGVTIDLGRLNTTTVHADRGTVSLSPGSRWLDVYGVLDPLGLFVVGGRTGTVGVAGLLIGGGNSFFTAREGFACDQVVAYEVVLASGEIVHATRDNAHATLFRALKGGTANFGIVTRFEVLTFSGTDLWGGIFRWDASQSDRILQATVDFADAVEQDPFSSAIVFWRYDSDDDAISTTAALHNTRGEVAGPSYDQFLSSPPTRDSARVSNMSDFATELNEDDGWRRIWFSLSFKNDKRVLAKAIELHEQFVGEVKDLGIDSEWHTQCMFQPLPTLFAQHSVARGGNMLGLDRADDNLILWLGSLAITDGAFEAAGRTRLAAYVDALDTYARSLDAGNDWIYVNYADGIQDPLSGYGQDNIDFIRNVATSYDPKGVFQTQSPSGFKISKVK